MAWMNVESHINVLNDLEYKISWLKTT